MQSQLIESGQNDVLNFSVITGYFPVGENLFPGSDTGIFFKFVTKQGETLKNMSSNTPILYWFNGGPGCSSQFGDFNEIGAFTVDENYKVSLRDTAWNKQAAIIFIDQPINVGFSFSDAYGAIVYNTVTASEMFQEFLKGFYSYQNFSTLNLNPTHFFGESYAGHYIPQFAYDITVNNQMGINLVGVGIGGSWTNTKLQMQYYDRYLFDFSIASSATMRNLQSQEIGALNDYRLKNYAAAANADDNMTLNNVQFFGNIDLYNVLRYGEQPEYNLKLLNSSTFTEGYGIPKKIFDQILQRGGYQGCNGDIYKAFKVDYATSYQTQVEYLLSKNKFVLIFNGQLDWVVNTPGAINWINTLNWAHIAQWKATDKKLWSLNNEAVGNFKEYDHLNFAVIYRAGHMIPSDQPQVAYSLLENYLTWARS